MHGEALGRHCDRTVEFLLQLIRGCAEFGIAVSAANSDFMNGRYVFTADHMLEHGEPRVYKVILRLGRISTVWMTDKALVHLAWSEYPWYQVRSRSSPFRLLDRCSASCSHSRSICLCPQETSRPDSRKTCQQTFIMTTSDPP